MERELEPRDERAAWRWVLAGCGVMVLGAFCLIPPIIAYVLLQETDGGPSADRGAPATQDPALVPDAGAGWAPAPPGPAPPRPGPGVPPPPDPALSQPRHVTATVSEVEGLARLRPGQTCAFDVTRHARNDGTFWCNAQVQCAGELLYGGSEAGYFDCTLYERPERHVVGEDPSTTSADRDAAMRLDTLREELVVRDDATGRLGAFTVRARVTSIR